MNSVCWILGGLLVALVVASGAAVVMLCRPARCPGCESLHIDEYPAHCVCRVCGERWEEPKRFGSHGGSDL